MTRAWQSDDAPSDGPIGFWGLCLLLLRGGALGLVLLTGLLLMLLLRLIERPLFGLRRPWTPWITVAVCRAAFWILRIRVTVQGQLMNVAGAVVANHASWLDIFTLNSRKRIYFVSKAEVERWPLIGALAKTTGTVFIERRRGAAAAQAQIFRDRLGAGHRLLFFPEGTSTDGQRVLPFKPTLFEAFFASELRDEMSIQPVTLIYRSPDGEDPRYYGWWGDMDFGPHLRKILAAPRQGRVEITYHPVLKVSDFEDRKGLAKACEEAVRQPFMLPR